MNANYRKRRIAADEAHAWARNLRLRNPYGKLVLSMLTLYVNGDGACYVGAATLADDCELALETVRRRISWLETIGAIVKLPQWIDENGKRNADGRGKRTTDEIRLMIDADIEAIESRAAGDADAEVSPLPARELTEEASPLPGTGPKTASQLLAPQQPPHSGGGLISEPEPEDSPPTPPPAEGGSVDDGFTEFEKDWDEPILKHTLARQIWAALTPAERSLACKAARGYVVWRKAQRKPPNPSSAQTFLRERDAWPQFAERAPDEQAAGPALTFIAEGSAEWKAYAVMRKIKGQTLPAAIHFDQGKGLKVLPLSTAELALAQFADDDANSWPLVKAGTQQCGAWRQFLGTPALSIVVGHKRKEITRGHWVEDWPIKETGLLVPRLWPPRKDGQIGPTDEEREQEVESAANTSSY